MVFQGLPDKQEGRCTETEAGDHTGKKEAWSQGVVAKHQVGKARESAADE